MDNGVDDEGDGATNDDDNNGDGTTDNDVDEDGDGDGAMDDNGDGDGATDDDDDREEMTMSTTSEPVRPTQQCVCLVLRLQMVVFCFLITQYQSLDLSTQ